MDADSAIGLRLLETIGQCTARQMEFSIKVRKTPEVLSTINIFECRTYQATGTSVSFYLDADLKSGKAISFQIELDWDEREWILSTRIILNYREGYDVIKQFPERRTEIFDELLINLIAAESELHNSSFLDNLPIL